MPWIIGGIVVLVLAVLVTWAIRFVLIVRRYDAADNIQKPLIAYLFDALPLPHHRLPPPPLLLPPRRPR